MMSYTPSNADLLEQIRGVLDRHSFAYEIGENYEVRITHPFSGDVYDTLFEELFDAVFGKGWCIIECDEIEDHHDLRSELVAKGIPFVEIIDDLEIGILMSNSASRMIE